MASVSGYLVLAAAITAGASAGAGADISIPPWAVFTPLGGTVEGEPAGWSGGFATGPLRSADGPNSSTGRAGDLFGVRPRLGSGDGRAFWSPSEATGVPIAFLEMAFSFSGPAESQVAMVAWDTGPLPAWPWRLETDSGRSLEHAVFMMRFAQLPGPGTTAVLGVLGVVSFARRR